MLEFISGIVVGAAVVWLLTVWSVRRYLAKMQQAADDRELVSSVIQARIEQIGNQFYIYNMDVNEFLVQGHTMKELVDKLELRKPGAVIRVVDGDEHAIQNLKATVQ